MQREVTRREALAGAAGIAAFLRHTGADAIATAAFVRTRSRWPNTPPATTPA